MVEPCYSDESVQLHHGDCLDVLRELPDCSVDSVVTDPPYGLEFMGKDWDKFGVGKQPQIGKPDGSKFRQNMGTPSYTDNGNPTCRNCGGDKYRNGPRKCACASPNFGNPQAESMRGFQQWCSLWVTECLRVLKPGGHLLAFGGTRTWHRLAVAVEDAGFEMRDSIAWLYGSGFPKSLDVSKAIDKRRDERADAEKRAIILAVTGWVAAARDAAGLSNRDIDAAFGTNGMAGHWTSSKSQPAVPTADQWPRLLELLGANEPPAEVRDAVDEWLRIKGQPAPTWSLRVVTREATATLRAGETISFDQRSSTQRERRDIPATSAAQQWAGWGTALKPAFEPIVVARKPLAGTVAANVLAHGTGALNIDATRVGDEVRVNPAVSNKPGGASLNMSAVGMPQDAEARPVSGRWPTNVVFDDTAAAELDADTGNLSTVRPYNRATSNDAATHGDGMLHKEQGSRVQAYGDSGGASRFFPVFRYQAKAPARERPTVVAEDGTKMAHPTVKPLALMQWLVRLVTPPGGVCLDPFAGSGTTVEACLLEGFHCIGIERDADYLPLVAARIERARSI